MRFRNIIIAIILIISFYLLINVIPKFFFDKNENLLINNNIEKGNITLFSQDYTKINELPNNIFIGNILSPCNYNASLTYNNTANKIQFKTNKNQVGELFITGLSSDVKCNININFNILRDNWKSSTNIYVGNIWIRYQILQNNDTRLFYFYQDTNNSTLKYKYFDIKHIENNYNLTIIYDGETKINKISYNSKNYIEVPFYQLSSRLLPYPVPCQNYVKISNELNEGYICVQIKNVAQSKGRFLITPIGNKRLLGFGFDGPHPLVTIEKGIDYLKSNGFNATLWFDVDANWRYNSTEKNYYHYLISNNSWEPSIHFHNGLSSLPINEAYNEINEEIKIISNEFGKIKDWCSLQNNDNITYAKYCYLNYGLLWRNGDSGIHAEVNIGNLDFNTWGFWKEASKHGFIMPCFTHETDVEPPIQYSISYRNFTEWVDNIKNSGIKIVPFSEYYTVQQNSILSSFQNIGANDLTCYFTAKTQNGKAWINLDFPIKNNFKIFDQNGGEINYEKRSDNSIEFFVESNHNYTIAPFTFKVTSGNIEILLDKWNPNSNIITSFYIKSSEQNNITFKFTLNKNETYFVYKNSFYLTNFETDSNGNGILRLSNEDLESYKISIESNDVFHHYLNLFLLG
jgi:hypothetical protein